MLTESITDLSTDDDKRKRLAVFDNSTSDTSEFDLELLQMDFKEEDLEMLGLDLFIDYQEVDEDLMDNDNLREFNVNKNLALSKMPLDKYLCILFDENNTKQAFIDKFIKSINPKTDINATTQFCDVSFAKVNPLDD